MTDLGDDPFAIDETPISLHYPKGGVSPLAVIESDLRRLMQERAEALHELEERRRTEGQEKEGVLRDLLEVLDAFERIFASVERKPGEVTPRMRRWLKNFSATWRLMQSILEHHGVQEMPPARGEFDPHLHEILELTPTAEVPEQHILSEERRGYLRLGRVLRKAGVVVAKEIAEGEPAEGEKTGSAEGKGPIPPPQPSHSPSGESGEDG